VPEWKGIGSTSFGKGKDSSLSGERKEKREGNRGGGEGDGIEEGKKGDCHFRWEKGGEGGKGLRRGDMTCQWSSERMRGHVPSLLEGGEGMGWESRGGKGEVREKNFFSLSLGRKGKGGVYNLDLAAGGGGGCIPKRGKKGWFCT